MFFGHRSTQAEYFDEPRRSVSEIAEGYRELARANRLFYFSHPFEMMLPRLLGADRCRKLEVLDLGAGDCSLGRTLADWAAQRGWQWSFTHLDLNPLALTLHEGGRKVAGSVLALPFKDNSFDVVIASQMTHHLGGDPEVTQHFREAWRVSREIILLSDVHRNAMLYGLVWAGTLALGLSRHVRADGLLSVRRGFRVPEWQALAEAAGIAGAKAWLYGGTRIMLQAHKQA